MRNILIITVLAIAVQLAAAMNYSATDLLLVFRQDNFNDVEFDIGSVSNLLGLATGTKVNINYDTNLVKGNFNNSFSGVRFAVVGATMSTDSAYRIWVTDADLSTPVTNMTLSKTGTVRGKIENVGINATENTSSNALPYAVAPSAPTSYSYLVSDTTGSGIGTFHGSLAFMVEAAYPATLAFYEMAPSGVTPKPPARLVGAFSLNADGTLTYTAGQLPVARTLAPSRITQFTRTNGVNAVSFTTTNGANYRLRYATTVSGAWTQLVGSVAGDNSVKVLTDTTADARRFYRVECY